MMTLLRAIWLGGIFVLGESAGFAAASLTPVQPACEGRKNPAGIDVPQPRLSWQLQSTEESSRGLRQSGWQVLVADSREEIAADHGTLWDSGKVPNDETYAILYGGKKLASSQRVYWKVRVWDQAGVVSPWSSVAEWTMGVLTPADWAQARWIALPKPKLQSQCLRREFLVNSNLVRAIVHVTGLGQYELKLNGVKVGADLLTPAWTDYRKTVNYDSYDVTPMLTAGSNAVGFTLGNGMYSVEKSRERYNKFAGSMGPPQAILLLRLEYADDRVENIVTDGSWRGHAGPLTYSNVYGGEDHDARLDFPGWSRAGFNAKDWNAVEERNGPGGRLVGLSAAGWPIRVVETLRTVSQKLIKPGVTVYDLGQNAPVIPRLKVSGPAGAVVKIIPSELIKDSGEIDDTVCRGNSYWQYTLSGCMNENWLPQFFYRGARYLQVELQPAELDGELPRIESLEAAVVQADAPAVGSFATSSDLLNRIYPLVRWAQRGNMVSVLTDCPHREKLGWLEEAYLNGPALRYNFDLNPLFAKIENDIADAQLPNGLVPNIAPEYTVFGWWGDMQFRESPEWGSAFIQIPWQQYLFTGDLALVHRNYEAMSRYVKYLATHVDADGIIRVKGSLGDWYDLGPKSPGRAQLTPIDLTATAIYYDDLKILAEFAAKLGRREDALEFSRSATSTQQAFDRTYFDKGKGSYASGSQTANAMPYAFGMVAPEQRSNVLARIVADVNAQGLTAGDVGYRYLLRALAEGGRSDVVFAVNHQSEKPGYGFQLAHGATSLTEAWDANRSSSQNHFMLGQINEWFFHDLAGIQPDPAAAGFKKFVIKPAIVGDLRWVKAEYESMRGTIGCKWERTGNKLTLEVVVPPNLAATIYMPCINPDEIRESGRLIGTSPDCKLLRVADGAAILELGSGHYSFAGRL